MNAATIQRRGGAGSALKPAVTVGKQQYGVAVHRPEAAQYIARGIRQRHQPVLIAFGVPDMHAPTHRIDVADLQTQALTEAQAQTVDSEVEDSVTESLRGREQSPSLLDGNDIG